MAEKTKISWTDHTFSPWWGCFKVSPGCQNCYANTLASRYGHDIWGPPTTTTRRIFGEKHWAGPLKWNAKAEAEGVPRRVFCASMADVFEEHPQLPPEREKLWALIERTPRLDWQLLTKRPEHIRQMVPVEWLTHWPVNVWVGTSVENQEQAEKRIPTLLRVPATVRFLSCEPLLGPIDLRMLNLGVRPMALGELDAYLDALEGTVVDEIGFERKVRSRIQWVIVGGESGPGHRPMNPNWARRIRDHCQATGVPVFMKQDSGPRSGMQGRLPDDLWLIKEFPRGGVT